MAGQFTVASCQADRLGFSTTAFNDFATRGMRIRRACNPEGPGIRGLVTTNIARPGSVPRGSVALVDVSAPAGTHFTTFRWAGTARRTDCRYALQLYAEGPDIKPVPIKNVRANQNCAQRSRAQAAGYRARTFNVAGATRIVQRVICMGGNGFKSCSTDGYNYLRTYKAQVGVRDDEGPAAAIAVNSPFTSGQWVGGSQAVDYDARDNVGVRAARVVAGDRIAGEDKRTCNMATATGEFAIGTPCPNGPGHIEIRTATLLEGTQQLVVQAEDAAGNLQSSAPVTVRIDNTAPGRVPASATGGDAWRNTNDFSLEWANPPEGDRAPISAAEYKLCPASGGQCRTDKVDGDGITRLPVQVPGPGVWSVSMWRRDAAGNADAAMASDEVALRYDPDPPQLGFTVPSSTDPTLVTVPVTDTVSGLAGGTIEMSRVGSNTWTSLETMKDGDRLVARINDAGLPSGSYVLRATARDQARNEASTTTRTDGQPMTVALPLRIASTMRTGLVRHRTVRKVVRRNGKRRTVRERVAVLRPSGVIRLGRTTPMGGRLTNRDGAGIADAEIQVLASVEGTTEQLVGVVRTTADGSFAYSGAGSNSRTIRFAYAGSPLILPTESRVKVVVPAVSTLTVNRRRVVNGQGVVFSGRVRSVPVPASGKLIQVEVLLSGDGRHSARLAPTRAVGGGCRTASTGPPACSGIGSASPCPAKPATRLDPARPSQSAYESGGSDADDSQDTTDERVPRAQPCSTATHLRKRDVHACCLHRARRNLVCRLLHQRRHDQEPVDPGEEGAPQHPDRPGDSRSEPWPRVTGEARRHAEWPHGGGSEDQVPGRHVPVGGRLRRAEPASPGRLQRSRAHVHVRRDSGRSGAPASDPRRAGRCAHRRAARARG